jgi:hypothetical protein
MEGVIVTPNSCVNLMDRSASVEPPPLVTRMKGYDFLNRLFPRRIWRASFASGSTWSAHVRGNVISHVRRTRREHSPPCLRTPSISKAKAGVDLLDVLKALWHTLLIGARVASLDLMRIILPVISDIIYIQSQSLIVGGEVEIISEALSIKNEDIACCTLRYWIGRDRKLDRILY